MSALPLGLRVACLAFLVAHCASTAADRPALLQPYAEEARQWEADIRALEALDEAETYPDSSILFIGSSSIRLWTSMDEALAPYSVIRRGYGGAKYSDVAWYAERLIYPHAFQAVLFFVGNDIWGTPDDKTPEEISRLAHYLVDVVRARHPETPIFFVEVTPIPSRWHLQPLVDAENAALRAVAEAEANVHFIATRGAYIGPDGKPREELFGDDRLHQNDEGYALWASLLKRELGRVLR